MHISVYRSVTDKPSSGTIKLYLMHLISSVTKHYVHEREMAFTQTKNRSIGPELMTAKTGPIHPSSFVEIAFVD